LFKSTNGVVKHHYKQTSATFFQLLQPDVMHSFDQIASEHVSPFSITKLLQNKGKKKSTKFKMSQHRCKHKLKWSANGI
jgi:hypothetical protein